MSQSQIDYNLPVWEVPTVAGKPWKAPGAAVAALLRGQPAADATIDAIEKLGTMVLEVAKTSPKLELAVIGEWQEDKAKRRFALPLIEVAKRINGIREAKKILASLPVAKPEELVPPQPIEGKPIKGKAIKVIEAIPL